MQIRRANKVHICTKCGCNIERGQMHKTERAYQAVKYDDEFDFKSGGVTETIRYHEHSLACDLAINKVMDYFFKRRTS